jgi:hypothetical protein
LITKVVFETSSHSIWIYGLIWHSIIKKITDVQPLTSPLLQYTKILTVSGRLPGFFIVIQPSAVLF